MTTQSTQDLTAYGIDSRWLRNYVAERRILFVYAHPDDESFGNAGTILRYANDGVAVHYACATRGEAGDVPPEMLAGYADVGALRTVEQMCAASVLGLTGVHFLGHRDSGMAGSPDNQHPAALIRQPLARVAGQIVALIRAIQPHVVVTFGPYGGYGHPDHIFCHRATTAAFEAAGNPTLYSEQIDAGLSPWQPQRLYYSTFGTRFLSSVVFVMRVLGKDPSRFGRNGDVDLVRAAREATPVTTTIDTSAYFEQAIRARECHHSQGGGIGWLRRLPKPLQRRLNSVEHFTRVAPPWNGGSIERDLFPPDHLS
ncbi:MAG: PIG-L family deacetylase [Roseiflexaceae bacterium]|nr:PIG-L family deacetylase [Roseiflexus sp.]MDW8214604.1 PIG-L family deacetylase [Roseiflexaceae bacterium]